MSTSRALVNARAEAQTQDEAECDSASVSASEIEAEPAGASEFDVNGYGRGHGQITRSFFQKVGDINEDEDVQNEQVTLPPDESVQLFPSPNSTVPLTSPSSATLAIALHSHSHAFPTTLADLHKFPPDANLSSSGSGFYHTLKEFRQSTLSIHNRLNSILSDSVFVTAVSSHYSLPLIANERCGSWYIPPSCKAGSVYFKSTDGHHGQWGFSLRRLNLQLLKVLGEKGGAVVVDSTRRGKGMSDALGKTVPIWVAVLNRVLFPEDRHAGLHGVRVAGEVGESERSQIEERVEGWCEGLRGLELDLEKLMKEVRRPIRLEWAVNGEWEGGQMAKKNEGENLLVLCSASRRVRGAEMSEGGYVQGAGDDSEGWSRGLTSTVFWVNKDLLLETAEEDLPELIERLVREEREAGSAAEAVMVKPTRNIFLGVGARMSDEGFDLIVNCNGDSQSASHKILDLKCREGKLGSKDLREKVGVAKSFATTTLERNADCRILITCSTGKDISVGLALVLLCLFFEDWGQVNRVAAPGVIDKVFVKKRLVWITSCKPDANPSRATLQAVNSFLIDRPS